MFRDAKEELQRIQAQLLEEEETKVLPNARQLREEADRQQLLQAEDAEDFEDIADFLDMDEEELERLLSPQQPLYRNYANDYGTSPRLYDFDREGFPQARTPEAEFDDEDAYDEDIYEDEPEAPRRKLGGLIALATLLLLGIAGVLLYWVVRFL